MMAGSVSSSWRALFPLLFLLGVLSVTTLVSVSKCSSKEDGMTTTREKPKGANEEQHHTTLAKEEEEEVDTASLRQHAHSSRTTILPITGDGIVERVCDYCYKTRKKHDLDNGTQVASGSVICTTGQPNKLVPFFRDIVPDIKFNFTLVTVEHDEAIPHDFSVLDTTTNLIAWFGRNIGIHHPKLHALPIGLNAERHQHIYAAIQKHNTTKKNGRMLINFNQNQPWRQWLFRLATERKQFEQFGDYFPRSSKWGILDGIATPTYYDTLAQYSFEVCPRGAGEDTHRVWEALYMGVRPIVLKSILSELYEGTPVIQLNYWEELTKELIDREKNRTVDFKADRLDMNYWVDKIRKTAKTGSYEP